MNDTVSEVLVVEDVRSIREIVRVALEDAGYHVFEVANGRSAQRMLRRSPCPMVVILDADLPGLGADVILSRAADDAALARHAYIYLTGMPPDQLSPSLRQLLTRLHVPVLQMPFTVETLLEVTGQVAGHPVDAAVHGSPDAQSVPGRS